MLTYHLFNYKITVSPVYAVRLLNHMWATEPVGSLSICIMLAGILLTVGLKLLDIMMEAQREKARAGCLRMELILNRGGDCEMVLANVGKEPLVIRQVGTLESRFWQKAFQPIPNTALPQTLNAYGLVHLNLGDIAGMPDFSTMLDKLTVQDSLGRLWPLPRAERRRARARLHASRQGQRFCNTNPSGP